MVEIHYEEQRANEATGEIEPYHWRVIVNDEQAALEQVAQDLADGREPLTIVQRAAKDPWDVRVPYDPAKWKAVVPRGEVRRRAASIRAAFS